MGKKKKHPPQTRFDCTDEEKRRWAKAARADGNRSVASWIRARLNEAARRELGESDDAHSDT